MLSIQLQNTVTKQVYEFSDIEDKNNGKKLFYKFNLNLTDVPEGEYEVTLYKDGEVIKKELLKLGDFNNKAIQYSKGNNIFIDSKPVYDITNITITANGEYTAPELTAYDTISVDVPTPKISVEKNKLKLAYSSFTEIPDIFDFEGVSDMEHMFENCESLKTILKIENELTKTKNMFTSCYSLSTLPEELRTKNVTNMEFMFQGCHKLSAIPKMNTSNVTNMYYMFSNCQAITTIPQMDTTNVVNMENIFERCFNLKSVPALNAEKLSMYSWTGLFGYTDLPNLTDFGGLIGLKTSLTNDFYGFPRVPNLSYQSCINILNGLYDFTGNGETPTSSEGQLLVHQNFLDAVGDEISIGTNKGWVIYA